MQNEALKTTEASIPTHILLLFWRGLLDSTKRGAFWVAVTLYAIAFAITYKYPDQSIFSLDKIIYGLATITAVFNWGRSTQQEMDEAKHEEGVVRQRDSHRNQLGEIHTKHREEIDALETSLIHQVSIQAGLLQRTTQSLAESLHDAEQKDAVAGMLAERLKMLVPQFSQAILNLSELCEESPAERRVRTEAVESVMRQNTGIENKITQLNLQAQQLLARVSVDPNASTKMGADIASFLETVVSSSTSLSDAVRKTSVTVAVLDNKTRVSTGVPCPRCGRNNNVLLGQYRGASAMHTCEGCGKAFNAHVAAGGPFTVPLSNDTLATEYVRIECPNSECKDRIFNVATVAGDTRKEERGCFGCGAVMEIDMATRKSRLIEKKSKKKGKIVNDKLSCVEDNSPVNLSIPRSDGRVGYCKICRTVVSTESAI